MIRRPGYGNCQAATSGRKSCCEATNVCLPVAVCSRMQSVQRRCKHRKPTVLKLHLLQDAKVPGSFLKRHPMLDFIIYFATFLKPSCESLLSYISVLISGILCHSYRIDQKSSYTADPL